MTATPQPQWSPARTEPWGVGRIVALVLGVLLLVPGLGLMGGGGVLLWADLGNRDDGFVFSETDDFATAGHALVSERLELAEADWLPFSAALGTARAELTSAGSAPELFVGIGPAADVNAYLDGVGHSVIDDLGTGSVDEVAVPGGPPPGPPGEQDFWSVDTSGPGTQRLDWEPAEGDWVFVVMNADGSAGVAVDARIGASVPALGGLAWVLLGVGFFLVVISVLLLALSVRRPAPLPYAGPVYTGPPPMPPMTAPPPWTPPVPTDRTTAADGQPDPEPTATPPRPPSTG